MVSNLQKYEIQYSDTATEKSDSLEFKDQSDEDIWQSFKDGDEAAFIFIYRSYANLLYNYGAKFSQDRELVADCLQDFFLYLRKNRERLGKTTSIKLYLLKSFRRRVIEYVTKSLNEKKRNSNALTFQLEIEVSHELKYIDAQAKEEQTKKLNAALERLDQKEREAVFFFYYEGLSYKEIAELLEFSHVSSARRLIYRALGNLKELFSVVLVSVLNFF